MKSGFRIALATAAVAAGVAFAGASPAQAQVVFSGGISIGIGAPAFSIGTYVPQGYEVYSRDDCGYGFDYEEQWIPVRQYSGHWQVCEPSEAYGYPGSFGGYGSHAYRGYSRYNAHPSYRSHGYGQRYQVRYRDHGSYGRSESDYCASDGWRN